jgi:hypothetical protein
MAQLSEELNAPAFQYNVYDGTSHALHEFHPDGRTHTCGFNASSDEAPPDEDRFFVQFRLVDVAATATWAESAFPSRSVRDHAPRYRRPDKSRFSAEQLAHWEPKWAALESHVAQKRAALLGWLERIAARVQDEAEFETWSAHPSDVVRALAADGDSFLSIEGVIDAAILEVFGGPNSAFCDNQFLVQVLVPHAPMPVTGFVLYAESDATGG